MDVFNSNGEVYENACDLPPAAETVVAVPRAVDEDGRDVRAGVLRYLITVFLDCLHTKIKSSTLLAKPYTQEAKHQPIFAQL